MERGLIINQPSNEQISRFRQRECKYKYAVSDTMWCGLQKGRNFMRSRNNTMEIEAGMSERLLRSLLVSIS